MKYTLFLSTALFFFNHTRLKKKGGYTIYIDFADNCSNFLKDTAMCAIENTVQKAILWGEKKKPPFFFNVQSGDNKFHLFLISAISTSSYLKAIFQSLNMVFSTF
jgi:hypothetical protein